MCKLRFTRICVSLSVGAVAFQLGCRGKDANREPQASQAAPKALPDDPNARLDALIAENLDAELRASPTTATWLGAHSYDDRLDDVRMESLGHEVTRMRQMVDRVREIDEHALDPLRRIDRQLVLTHLDGELHDWTETRPHERSAMFYAGIVMGGIDALVSSEQIALPDRLRLVAARLRKIRPLFDEARRNLRVPIEPLARRAIDQLQGMKSYLTDTLPKLALSIGDSKLQDDLRASTGDAVRALDDFLAWLQKDLLPRSKQPEPMLGRERLLERLRIKEGIEISPETIAKAAEAELKEARRRYDDAVRIATAASGGRSLDLAKVLEDDHAKAEELLPQTQLLIDTVVAFVRAQRLVSVADGLRAVEMPPAHWGYLQLDHVGPLEPHPPQVQMWLDPVDRSWPAPRRMEHLRVLNRPQLVLTIIREGVPGRALQTTAARRAPTTMQKVFGSVVFQEGWAHYATMLMLEQGYAADDARVRVAIQRDELVRLARVAGVIRLHAMGAKLEDVIKLFTDEAMLDDYSARREAERIQIDPMALSAGLGRLAIRKLREDVRAARGASFDLRAFHDEILGHGTVPISVLRQILLPNGTGSLL